VQSRAGLRLHHRHRHTVVTRRCASRAKAEGRVDVNWHNPGCQVDPNDLGKIRLIRASTQAGERVLTYECAECAAETVIVVGRSNHRAGQEP
jgi:hypothetical protein